MTIYGFAKVWRRGFLLPWGVVGAGTAAPPARSPSTRVWLATDTAFGCGGVVPCEAAPARSLPD